MLPCYRIDNAKNNASTSRADQVVEIVLRMSRTVSISLQRWYVRFKLTCFHFNDPKETP